MASLTEIRDALKAGIESEITGFTIYPRVPGTAVGLCGIFEPDPSDYLQVMSQATWSWSMRLSILCPATDLDIGQRNLDALIDMDGERSIPQLILGNQSMGLSRTQFVPVGMSNYGGRHESGGLNHIGAVLSLHVHTGRSS